METEKEESDVKQLVIMLGYILYIM